MCQNNCGSGLISNTNLGADWVFYKTKIKETLNETLKKISKRKGKQKTRKQKGEEEEEPPPPRWATAQQTIGPPGRPSRTPSPPPYPHQGKP